MEAALDCFSTYGFEGASTRMISDLSGVTHSLILYHFESKDRLWIATMEEIVGTYSLQMREKLDLGAQRPAADILRDYLVAYVKLAASHPQIHRIMTQQSTQESARIKWVVENYLAENFNIIKDLIARGQEEGSVRPGDPARLYYMMVSIAGNPFTAGGGYRLLTGRNIFSPTEVRELTALILDVLLLPRPDETPR